MLENGTVIEAFVCDKLADYMYSRNLENFLIEGSLIMSKDTKNYIIDVKEIINICFLGLNGNILEQNIAIKECPGFKNKN